MKNFASIAFDLDDTLLDTSGLLIPLASERACAAMIAAGVPCELNACMEMRKELSSSLSHPEIFRQISSFFKAPHPEKAAQEALQEFYNPHIPSTLPLLPGSLENLEKLQSQYTLFLVTMGSLPTQEKKIKALGIEKYFKKIFIINGFAGEKKKSAFQEILRMEGHPANQLLSIGNRLSSEIRDGKTVGATTCYFAYGEHVGEIPQFPEDHPDYTISKHKDLILACGL